MKAENEARLPGFEDPILSVHTFRHGLHSSEISSSRTPCSRFPQPPILLYHDALAILRYGPRPRFNRLERPFTSAIKEQRYDAQSHGHNQRRGFPYKGSRKCQHFTMEDLIIGTLSRAGDHRKPGIPEIDIESRMCRSWRILWARITMKLESRTSEYFLNYS